MNLPSPRSAGDLDLGVKYKAVLNCARGKIFTQNALTSNSEALHLPQTDSEVVGFEPLVFEVTPFLFSF